MASRYWVGGSGTWNAADTSKWAATTGGASGASVPVSVDDVFFDANSGASVVTIESGFNPVVSRLTMTGFTGTLDYGVQNISLGGIGTVYLGATTFNVAGTPVINFTNATASTRTITPTATTEANAISINVTAGTGNVNIGTTSSAKNVDYTGFTGSGGLPGFLYGNLVLPAGMTVTASGNAIFFSATSGTQSITTNGLLLNKPLNFNAPNAIVRFEDLINQTSTRGFYIEQGTVQLKSGVTSTVGVFSTGGTNQKFLQSTLAGSQATLSQASGTVNASYLSIKDINATGGAKWNARTDLGAKDLGNNSGWNFFAVGLSLVFDSVFKKILRPIFGYR